MKAKHFSIPQLLATFLLLIQSAQSAVNITFAEVPGLAPGTTDVRVAWGGSLSVLVGGSATTTATVNGTSGNSNLSLAGDYRLANIGASTGTSLETLFPERDAATAGSWGFTFESLRWSAGLVGSGTYQNPSMLLFDPSMQFFVHRDTTLVAMGADSFSNTLAWTADSVDGGVTPGDTISYSVIPEPSGILLLSLSTLAFAVKRRRA